MYLSHTLGIGIQNTIWGSWVKCLLMYIVDYESDIPIPSISWQPILSPRSTASKEYVNQNEDEKYGCTNSNSGVEKRIIRPKSLLIIIWIVVVFVSFNGWLVSKEIKLLITHSFLSQKPNFWVWLIFFLESCANLLE